MDETIRIDIELDGVTHREANLRLEHFEQWLRANSPTTDRQRFSPHEGSQDAGTLLAVILGSASVVTFAKGLSIFVSRWGSSVTIKTNDGEVIARGDPASNIDVAKVVRELRENRPLRIVIHGDSGS